MSSRQRRPANRWAATAVIAGSMSAVLAAPMSLGSASGSTVRAERPILTVNDIRPGVVVLHARTNPGLESATIYFYKIVHGEKKLVDDATTGPAGRAHVRVHVQPGSTHRFVAKWVRIRNAKFRASNSAASMPRGSRYSNIVRWRAES